MFKYHRLETNRFRQETYKILINNIFRKATVTSLLFYLLYKKAFIKAKNHIIIYYCYYDFLCKTRFIR